MNQTDRLLYACDEGLPSLVTRLIGTNREATHWDFKRIWHKNNADLIHDIICLANNPKGHIGLLIIGVDDGAEHELIDVEEYSENRKDSQKITDLLRACRWLTTFPYVRVVPIRLSDVNLDVVLIEPNDDAIPYRLAKDYEASIRDSQSGRSKRKVVRAGTIYSRDGDSNTPIDGTADVILSEKLWRRHFGLDKTPLERASSLLREPSKWKSTLNAIEGIDEGFQNCYYHEDFPEFTYIRKFMDNENRYEYFMLASPFFTSPQWCISRIYYHQTMLYETTGAFSDHLYIPSPRIGFVRKSQRSYDLNDTILFGYFVEGSIEKRLLDFMLDESKEGPSETNTKSMLFRLLPLFKDKDEFSSFVQWCEQQWGAVVDKIKSHDCRRCIPKKIPARISESMMNRARTSETIVELLDEFRFAQTASET